jgi:hypothetical protein
MVTGGTSVLAEMREVLASKLAESDVTEFKWPTCSPPCSPMLIDFAARLSTSSIASARIPGSAYLCAHISL